MFGLQPLHLLLIALVALIIFGPSRLPEIGRSMGKSINEFKEGMKEAGSGFKEEVSGGENKTPGANTTTNPTTPEGK